VLLLLTDTARVAATLYSSQKSYANGETSYWPITAVVFLPRYEAIPWELFTFANLMLCIKTNANKRDSVETTRDSAYLRLFIFMKKNRNKRKI
jgi:hypothetical protein